VYNLYVIHSLQLLMAFTTAENRVNRSLNALYLKNPTNIPRKLHIAKTRFPGLHFCCWQHKSSWSQFDTTGFEKDQISTNTV